MRVCPAQVLPEPLKLRLIEQTCDVRISIS
jgi:hypothetical protein